MANVNYNERSWAIDLISEINLWASGRNANIKRAGGENTLKNTGSSLFPDVLLFGDEQKGRILQGWELKMPDTSIENADFIDNAKKKAELLSLNSFLLWNVSVAVLYRIEDDGRLSKVKTWDGLAHIQQRDDVDRHAEEIKAELHKILEDLNFYIQSGEIKSKSIIEVLNSEQVSTFISRNLGGYIDNLKAKSAADGALENEINLWWRYAKNDHPEEEDRYVVLARINLLYLVNKFLFAHILKSYQRDAEVIDSIDEKTNLADGLRVFASLSEKIDFWNIFQTQTFEQHITQEVWTNLVDFNNFLKAFNFQRVEKSLLHDLIGLTVYQDKRRFAGQFTTPQNLAEFIVSLALTDRNGMAIDPCCGSGTISREIFLQKRASVGLNKAVETTWASDKFSLPLQMATFNMVDPQAIGKVLQVFKEDATKLVPGLEIEFHDPYDGHKIKKPLPKFKTIISNLPFVQQEDLEELNPGVDRINAVIEEKLGHDYVLDGRSDLYAYLPFYFWSVLENQGKLAFIISNSWLGTHWGEIFFNALRGFYEIEAIITSGKGRWFGNAKVVTNVVLLQRKDVPGINPEASTKFVVLRKPLKELTTEKIKELAAVVSLRDSVDEEDIRVKNYTGSKIEELKKIGLNLNSLFTDSDWIGALNSSLIEASSLFDIARGERRGWDELFYPEGTDIEEEYLKPVLKTPRSVSKLIAEPDAVAFCCTESLEDLEQKGKSKALAWIKRFEIARNGSGILLPEALKRAGTNWYSMSPSTMGEIVTSINFGDRLFFARFNEPTFVNQRLVRFSRKDDNTDIELCHALLNTTLGLYFIEALGTGRGEGALDLSKDKLERDLKILNPKLFNKAQREEILRKFELLKQREIFEIEEELKQADRQEFDTAVLKTLGKEDLREKIKDALWNLYEIRRAVKF